MEDSKSVPRLSKLRNNITKLYKKWNHWYIIIHWEWIYVCWFPLWCSWPINITIMNLRFHHIYDIFKHFGFQRHNSKQLHWIELSKHIPFDTEIFEIFWSLSLSILQHAFQSIVDQWGYLSRLYIWFRFIDIPIHVVFIIYLDCTSDSVRKSLAFFISNNREPCMP